MVLQQYERGTQGMQAQLEDLEEKIDDHESVKMTTPSFVT